MRKADIKIGAAYLVEMDTYPAQRLKATVLEVPVVRMMRVPQWTSDGKTTVERPYRRDGRADAARVRTEWPYRYAGKMVYAGAVKDLPFAKILRPWSEADEHNAQISLTQDKRWASLASRAIERGVQIERSGDRALIGWDDLEALLPEQGGET
jgi:hypothetical protein